MSANPISREFAREELPALTRAEVRALLARAATARKLILRNAISPSDGLYYVIFASEEIRRAEQRAGDSALYSRGYRGGRE